MQVSIYRVVLFYLILLISIPLLSNFNGLYGQDSYAYLNYANHLHTFLQGEDFPPSFFWPIAYPLIGALLGFLSNNLIVSLLLVSISCSVLTFFFLYKSASVLYPTKKNESLLFLALFYCLSPFIIRISVSIMSDMLAICCISASFYFTFRFRQKTHLGDFLFLVFFSSLAIITRYVSFVVVLVPLLFCTLQVLKRKQFLYLFYGTLLILIMAIPHLYFKNGDLTSFVKHEWLRTWSLSNFFKNTFYTVDGLQSYPLFNILHVFANLLHPGFIFVGIMCLAFVKRSHFDTIEPKLVLISLIIYAFFLCGMPIQNQRFLLLSFPLVLLLYLAPASQFTSSPFFKKNTLLILGFVIVVQLALSFRAVLPFYKLNKLEKTIAFSLRTHTDYTTVYTSGMEGPLSAYGAPQTKESLYLNLYTRFEKHALVLLNPKEIDKQWQGKYPDLNWKRIKKYCHPRLLTTYSSGWELYEIN